MNRLLALLLASGLILFAAQICGADEVFPVVHNEPIAIRVLIGRDGHPLAKAHLTMVAGYTHRDIQLRIRLEEALTDSNGVAQLPNALANFPLLVVSIAKMRLCQPSGGDAIFSIELIRRDGLSAPNRCGAAIVQDAPGVFTVWVKTGKTAPDLIASARAAPQAAKPADALISKPSAATVSTPVANTPAPADGHAFTPAVAPAPVTAAAPVCPVVPGPAMAPSPRPARHRRKLQPPLARA